MSKDEIIRNANLVNETAIIDDGAQIGAGNRIWHWVHICAGAKLAIIARLVKMYIGNQVVIGNNVKIQNNVSVYDKVSLEDDVLWSKHGIY